MNDQVQPLWVLKKAPGTKPVEAKRRCHRCSGSGRCSCEICGGRREVYRGSDVFGRQTFTRCDGCYGIGTRCCNQCAGEGWIS